MILFHNKAFGYGEPSPDHEFLALNYGMTELQGAVALAQLEKVEGIVRRRQEMAAQFTSLIATIPGIQPQRVPSEARSAYWKYTLRVDEAEAGADVGQLATYLYERFGIPSSPRYVQKPAFQCRIFRERRTFGDSKFPFEGPHRDGLPPVEYRIEDYPGAVDALAHMLVLPWNENFTDEHITCMADGLRQAVLHFRGSAMA
jgi:dTDP-4-amino-4,6-dideoxygalactose transaminase